MSIPGRRTRRSGLDDFARRARPRIRRMVRRWGVPDEDADDLVQQTLMALVGSWSNVRNPDTWVAGATRKTCLMYWRTRRRRIYDAVDGTVLEWLAAPERPAQEHRALGCDLSTLAARLPARYRSVLRLRFALGYDAREIARHLGYRQSSIGKVTSRGLAALRGELEAARAAQTS